MARGALLTIVVFLASCSVTTEPGPGGARAKEDAGVLDPAADAALAAPDAEEIAADVGAEPADLGTAPAPDAGALPAPDSGTAPDAAAPPPDAGFADATALPVDAGVPDVGARPDAGPADSGVRPDGGAVRPDSGEPALNPGWIGGACTGSADCNFTGGTCLTGGSGWPGGTCTQSCTRTCPDQTGALNSVTFCIDDGNGDANGLCVSRCDFTLSPTGCRAGYVCLPEERMGQAGYLRNVCVPIAGVPGRPAPRFDIGAACTSGADCARKSCITDLPGGYCTQERCDVVGCPAGSQCFNLGGQEQYFACLKTCGASSECRTAERYTCDSDSTCWPLPPPPSTCDLTPGPSDCAPYAAMATPDFVVVTKSQRRLTLCRGATRVNSWCVGLGSSPVLDKEREGDRRTPEGVFYVPRKIASSQYYKAFLISYPDAADAARGLAAGLITQAEHDAIVRAQSARREPPQNTGLGGLIEIHGGGGGSDWTWGCIANENSTIDVLWPVIDVGDTVVILH